MTYDRGRRYWGLGRLRVEQLCYRQWGPIDLAIEAGECVCLSGPSGSGKTLLLRAIADLDPHEGRAFLDAIDHETALPTEWRRRVGMLPAESLWWHDSVGPHLHNPDSDWIPFLGLEPAVTTWPITRLSTGERQRLALIRLLCNKPDALLLDEPTASCDPVNVRRVEKLIDRYRAATGAAVLWVSHDPEQIARISDRHVRMQNREIVG